MFVHIISILILSRYIIQYILVYVFSYIIITLSSIYISKSPSKPLPLNMNFIITSLPQLPNLHNQQAIAVHTICVYLFIPTIQIAKYVYIVLLRSWVNLRNLVLTLPS
jgi:hypothetical protein